MKHRTNELERSHDQKTHKIHDVMKTLKVTDTDILVKNNFINPQLLFNVTVQALLSHKQNRSHHTNHIPIMPITILSYLAHTNLSSTTNSLPC